MQCPRCGATDGDARAACWNCFAQLHAPTGSSPQKIRAPKAEPPPAPKTDPSPTIDMDNDQAIQAAEEVPAGKSPIVLDLDEPHTESKYVVPGLVEQPGPEAPSAPAKESPGKSNAIERPARAKKLPVVVPIIIILLAALAVAWWFLLANPSPVTAARRYVGAMQAAMSGDTAPLRTIVSSNSQAEVESLARMSGMMRATGIKTEVQKVSDCTVTGDKAEVHLQVKTSQTNMPMAIEMPMGIALVREGSIIRRQWKVDLAATNVLQMRDANKMLKQIFPQGLPNKPPVQGYPKGVTVPPAGPSAQPGR